MTIPNDELDMLKRWIAYPLSELAEDPQAQLQALQAVLPGRLPDDYVRVLLALKQAFGLDDNRIQAVEPPCPRIPGQFTCVGENPGLGILYGLGGGADEAYNVAVTWSSINDQMPKGLVPIGNSYGDEICLDISEAGNGRIFYWWHEGDPGEHDAEGYPGWGNTFMLAHSFTDLCARIGPPPPADPDKGPSGARFCWIRP